MIDRALRSENSTAPARWRVRDHDEVYPGLDLHKPMWVRMTSHGNIWTVNTDSLFFIPSASTARCDGVVGDGLWLMTMS